MAYIDQDNSREKTFSGVIAITLVGAVGYALVSGLALSIVREPPGVIPGTSYRAPPPPPPPHPTPRLRKAPSGPHTTTVTPPIVPIDRIDPVQIDLGKTTTTIDIGIGKTPNVPTQPPQPAQDHSAGATPRGDKNGWVTTVDYPPSAVRAGVEGRTGFRLDIGIDGKATACTIVSSSGSDELDGTACRLLMRRARFTPAKDESGNPIASTYANAITWKLPAD